MIYDYNKLKEMINRIYPHILDIRRDLHMHPELSEHEERTSELIQAELDALHVPYCSNIAGHGIYATITGKSNSYGIGIRADMDALPIEEQVNSAFKSVNPGVMHACGHDIHTSILLGTAQILSEIKDVLPASVRLIFQPSEETIGGARQMIDEGCLENPPVPYTIGLHVEPYVECGKIELIQGFMNAASCEFEVTVTGESCHGAHPDKGIDSLLPACNMVTSIQSIITRRLDPADTCLITVGRFNSGTKNNIISGETTFSGIIRTLNLTNRSFIKAEIKKMCDSIAASYGASCKITFADSYPSLENNNDMFNIIQKETEKVLGPENVITHSKPSLGADDFAYFCHTSKGLYYNIGSGRKDEEQVYPLHSEFFNPDEECIKTGILTEVISVLKLMEEKENERI